MPITFCIDSTAPASYSTIDCSVWEEDWGCIKEGGFSSGSEGKVINFLMFVHHVVTVFELSYRNIASLIKRNKLDFL